MGKSFALLLVLVLSFLAVAGKPPVSYANPIGQPLIFDMTITILSPRNIESLSENNFLLNISITDIPNNTIRLYIYPDFKPGSPIIGIRPNAQPIRFTGSAWIYLDGNATAFAKYPISFDVVESQPPLYYSFNLTNLPEGENSISVKVSCASQYSLDLHGVSVPTNITVRSKLTTPTMPYSSQTTPPSDPPQTFSNAPIIGVSITVALATGLGLFAYFKRVKNQGLTRTLRLRLNVYIKR